MRSQLHQIIDSKDAVVLVSYWSMSLWWSAPRHPRSCTMPGMLLACFQGAAWAGIVGTGAVVSHLVLLDCSELPPLNKFAHLHFGICEGSGRCISSIQSATAT